MTLHEPATFVTDLVLGALTAMFAARLFQRARESRSRAIALWGGAFVASAVAALLGGFWHGFAPEMSASVGDTLWRATLYAGGATGFFLMASAVTAALEPPARRGWQVLLAAKAVAYLAIVTRDPDFRWLVYDYGSALVGVAAFQIVRIRTGNATGAAWILAGIAGSVGAALVQQSGVSLHPRFNHNDLYHVLQMGATALLYRGGRALK